MKLQISLPSILKFITVITDQQIRDFLIPHQNSIRKWHDEAAEKIEQLKEILGVEVYKRSSSGVFNNYVLEKAKAYFENIKAVEEILVDDKYKSLIVYFRKANLAARFKKLNKNTLLSVGNEKDRFKAFIKAAVVQGGLFPDYEPKIGVEIGYYYNMAGTAIEKIFIVKKIDDKISIPIMEIMPLDNVEIQTLVAKEIIIDLEQEQQLKIKTGKK